MVKHIILDTDIGGDCDDAVALGMLLNLHKKGICSLDFVSVGTCRAGAVGTVNAILNYYGVNVAYARMGLPPVKCDGFDRYAKVVSAAYVCDDTAPDSVREIRKLLYTAKHKYTLVGIGPLTNLSRVLNSPPDVEIPYSGCELFHKVVEKVVIMGCNFSAKVPEWNIEQDIAAAQSFLKTCPCPLIVVPAEEGEQVLTGDILEQQPDNPVWRCIIEFSSRRKKNRSSWDPLTCLCAVENTDIFSFSEAGHVYIDEQGVAGFDKDEKGKHVIARLNVSKETARKTIHDYVLNEEGTVWISQEKSCAV